MGDEKKKKKRKKKKKQPVWPTWAVGAIFRGARRVHVGNEFAVAAGNKLGLNLAEIRGNRRHCPSLRIYACLCVQHGFKACAA